MNSLKYNQLIDTMVDRLALQNFRLGMDTVQAICRALLLVVLVSMTGCTESSSPVENKKENINTTASGNENATPVPVSPGIPKVIFPDNTPQDVIDVHLKVLDTATYVLGSIDKNCETLLQEEPIDFEITLNLEDSIRNSPWLDNDKKKLLINQPNKLDSMTIFYEDDSQTRRHLIIIEETVFRRLGSLISNLAHELCHIHIFYQKKKQEETMDWRDEEIRTIAMSVEILNRVKEDLRKKGAPPSVVEAIETSIDLDLKMSQSYRAQQKK